ncbi:MAG: ATP-dependent zinc metalloprotease FtsH, partial [Gammaproteobacteria bacterium]|nr:ATP-dependent zinc metalloprotease FtsH [Gammaproteobacteria bacterium]
RLVSADDASVSGWGRHPSWLAAQAPASDSDVQIPYSDFVRRVRRNEIAGVVISGQSIQGALRNGSHFSTMSPGLGHEVIIDTLIRNKARVSGAPPPFTLDGDDLLSVMFRIFSAALPMLLLIVAWWYLNARARGSPGSPDLTRMRRSPAQHLVPGAVKVTLGDVAGIDEVKQEVAEIVDYLRDPDKYTALGARIPRGVLLAGPPGTGKTLLARAIAGEAGVPFFSISGSAFVEIYVGVGAARVRDLFIQARLQAPCILFIDEIDAVGRHRAMGSGGNDEREQTLNQLLVEMDGFTGTKGIIVIAATNRPDVLDPALLRPGRFDRRVPVPLPDVRGREAIVRTHLRGVPIGSDAQPDAIARAAAGFSGAELANLVNEAALFAAREGAHEVAWKHFEQALDKLTLGLERHSAQPAETERRTTAYHEAGHAIVSLNVPVHDPIRKITIVPHGESLGATAHLAARERSSLTRRALESRLCALLGGRVAEELTVGRDCVTTGAADDLERANGLAFRMVAQYGLSEELGPICYLHGEVGAGTACSPGMTQGLSRESAAAIDRAQRALIEASYTRARAILTAQLDALHTLAAALLRYDTLDAAQIHSILSRPSARRCPKKSSRHDSSCSRSSRHQGQGVLSMANSSDCGHAVS